VQSQTIVTSFSQLESRFLHGEGILHRDLKSLNVLVDEAWRCKVADFDQSRVEADTLTATVGTVLWSAPEVLRGQGDYGMAADVYSFGIVMFECWTREAPFQHPGAPRRINVREHIVQGGRPVCPVSVGEPPAKYGEVMRRCWDEVAGGRPTMGEVAELLDSVALEDDPSVQRASGDTQPHGALESPRHDDYTGSTSAQPQSQERRRGSWLSSLMRPKRENNLENPLLPLTASEPTGKPTNPSWM